MAKTTPAKVESNRRNARKSTGPKTEKGKDAVKWNAMKHGLLAQQVVIAKGDGKEDLKQFGTLLYTLRAELGPVGVLEEMLVERIAVCYWRLRRAVMAETGVIRKQLDCHATNQVSLLIDNFNDHKRFPFTDAERMTLRRSTMGVTFLKSLLEDAKAEAAVMGKLSDDTMSRILAYWGSDSDSHGAFLFLMNSLVDDSELTDADFTTGKKPPKAKLTANLITGLDGEIERLNTCQEFNEELESSASESTFLANHIPPDGELDRLQRYETTIERQLYRAINQLERLQRGRSGQPIPPPINVEINSQN
ncbi:MAG: hypothetical protein RBT76_07370 [candidate division Zixibacteria bacterium]|jgi:hypothetical protein|nr:hypothetical protein [candidate division Zixibacteria bacterium]